MHTIECPHCGIFFQTYNKICPNCCFAPDENCGECEACRAEIEAEKDREFDEKIALGYFV